jgi:hypothetical protein
MREVVPTQLELIAKAMEVGKPEVRRLAMKLMGASGIVLDLERRLRKMLGEAAPKVVVVRKRRRPILSRGNRKAAKPKLPAPKPKRDAMGRDTLDERIVEHMTRFSDDTFQAMAVTKALDLEPRRVTSVASALVKLAHRGRIKRIGRGEYQGIAP